MTSRRAATRGMMFLPTVVAAATIASYLSGERDDERGRRLGEPMLQRVALGEQHLGDAVELRSGFGGGFGVLAGDEHMDVAAQLPRGRQRLGGLVGQRGVVVIGNEKSCHCRFPVLSVSKHAGFVLQLVDQLGDRGDLDAGLAAFRLLGLQHL